MTRIFNPGLHHQRAHSRETVHGLARMSLIGFLLTFILARAMVFLIMARDVPNMYFFLHGTHIHHLNYGICLLSLVAGFSVYRRPDGRMAEVVAVAYGVAMALIFDEFGMWLHLGGSYWQRASVDAVIIVAALLTLLGFASSIRRFESKHLWAFILLLVLVCAFGVVLFVAGNRLGEMVGPRLHDLEVASSP